jgi:hypothetical protein
MSECYICGRETIARCSTCRKDICKVHSELGKGKSLETSTFTDYTCTSCNKKKRLKRIQIIAFAVCAIMGIAIVLGLVFSYRFLWS